MASLSRASIARRLRLARRALTAGFDALVEPRICPACSEFSPRATRLCAACARLLAPALPSCARCEDADCARCRRRLAPLRRVRALYEYRGTAGELIRRAKLEQDSSALGFLARALRRSVPRARGRSSAAWVVVPVPLSRSKRRARGFNQAAVFADALASRLAIAHVPALRRSRDTATQGSRPTLEARAENVAGAFAHTRSARRVRAQRVLLVDDVITSGATLRECARALRRAGALEVEALVCARASRA